MSKKILTLPKVNPEVITPNAMGVYIIFEELTVDMMKKLFNFSLLTCNTAEQFVINNKKEGTSLVHKLNDLVKQCRLDGESFYREMDTMRLGSDKADFKILDIDLTLERLANKGVKRECVMIMFEKI